MSDFLKVKAAVEYVGTNVKAEEVTIGKFTETFHFKLLSHAESTRINKFFKWKPDGTLDFSSNGVYQREFLVATLVNPDGSPLVDENGHKLTADYISKWPAVVVTAFVNAATKANRMGADAKVDAAKNSNETEGDTSS